MRLISISHPLLDVFDKRNSFFVRRLRSKVISFFSRCPTWCHQPFKLRFFHRISPFSFRISALVANDKCHDSERMRSCEVIFRKHARQSRFYRGHANRNQRFGRWRDVTMKDVEIVVESLQCKLNTQGQGHGRIIDPFRFTRCGRRCASDNCCSQKAGEPFHAAYRECDLEREL